MVCAEPDHRRLHLRSHTPAPSDSGLEALNSEFQTYPASGLSPALRASGFPAVKWEFGGMLSACSSTTQGKTTQKEHGKPQAQEWKEVGGAGGHSRPGSW